jgi:hypothetical protein
MHNSFSLKIASRYLFLLDLLPPNVVLLTGLRGLLVESKGVHLHSEDIDIGDPAVDEHFKIL